jgi:hypothetical protein
MGRAAGAVSRRDPELYPLTKPYVRIVTCRVLLPPPGNARILISAQFVNNLGNGAYLTTSALFLTRSVGLTPAEVAVGLSVAAAAGMAVSTPMGYIADRYGPKQVMVTTLLVLAVAFATMTAVRGLWSFALLACIIAAGETCAKSANGAMVAAAVPPDQRLRVRAGEDEERVHAQKATGHPGDSRMNSTTASTASPRMPSSAGTYAHRPCGPGEVPGESGDHTSLLLPFRIIFPVVVAG